MKHILIAFCTLSLTGCQTPKHLTQHPPSPDQGVFQEIVAAHKKYGASPQDWPIHDFHTNQIQQDVILAPLYGIKYFTPHVAKTTFIAKGRFPVYEIETKKGKKISFIVVGVGACNTVDAVLALAGTNCKRILFVGSVGSLTPQSKIGDLVIPNESVSGCGVDMYLSSVSFLHHSTFGKSYFADEESQKMLVQLATNIPSISIQQHKVFSIDTVLGEYSHLREIQSLGCQAVEMETASLFHAAKIIGRKAVALLYVSDCTLAGQSFYHGRTENMAIKKGKLKKEIIPRLILSFFEQDQME